MVPVIREPRSRPSRAPAVDPHAARAAAALPRVLARLRKLHLWLGILLSPFLVVVAATGIAINHFGGGILKKLHTGKSFGLLGRLTVDLVALGLIALVVTGLALWIGPRIIKAHRQRHRLA